MTKAKGHFERVWKDGNGEWERVSEVDVREALAGCYSAIDDKIEDLVCGSIETTSTMGAIYRYRKDGE